MKKLVIFGIILVLFCNFIFASFDTGASNNSIEEYYAPGAPIRGWINLSFNEEPTNSVFEDGDGNSITLFELLNKTNSLSYEEYEYSCSVSECESDFSASSESETKTFSLGAKEEKIIGFKFTEDLQDITDVNFVIKSTAGASCYNQLRIDFFADGIDDFGNNQLSGTYCDNLKTYGCFNSSKATTPVSITGNHYCQRITFSESPGFKIGAWVQKNGEKDMLMSVYDLYGGESKATCTLPDASLGGGEISCDIDFLITESQDYYVCIYGDSSSGTGEYKLKGYSDSINGCGFPDNPSFGKSENAAYQIFIQGKQFDSVGNLEIVNSFQTTGETLSSMIKDYIISKYGDLDCSDSACVVPVLINSRIAQGLILSDLIIKKNVNGFGSIEEKNFYEIQEIPATITADFQKFYLNEGGFNVSHDIGEFTFELSFNDEEILSAEVIVEDVPELVYLKPTKTISAFPTTFEIKTSSSANITKYQWEFGDGINLTTTSNKATHIYNSTGDYEIKITVTDSQSRNAYKIYTIKVGSPKDTISEMLDEMQLDLTNVKANILTFGVFEQTSLNSFFDISNLNADLKDLQIDFASATTESEFNQIMTDLLALNIPESVFVSSDSAMLSYYPQKEIIDLDALKTIGGGDFGSIEESKYVDAIFAWNQENMEAKISQKEFSAKYGDLNKIILRRFKITLKEKEGLGEDSFFIIDKLEGLLFKENYLETEKAGKMYIDIKNPLTTIEFSATEDVYFSNLPAFISPSLSRLVIIEGPIIDDDTKTSRWVWFTLIIILLIIVGFVVYIFLQQWYKKRYENYLFKNQNNLYNLINYVENAKKKGLEEKEIISKLKKTGWKSEQIRYVTRKHSGKRTGMVEIPFMKLLNKLKFKKKVVEGKNPQNQSFNPFIKKPFIKNPSPNFNNRFDPKRFKK